MGYYILAVVVLIVAIIILLKFVQTYECKKALCVFLPAVVIVLVLIFIGTPKEQRTKNEGATVVQELQELPDGNFIWEKEEEEVIYYDVGTGPKEIPESQVHISEVEAYVHQIETYGDNAVIIIPKGKKMIMH